MRLIERLRYRLDARTRQGMVLVAAIYMLGWTLGRASGKVSVLERYAGVGGH